MKDGKYFALFVAGVLGVSLVCYTNGKDHLDNKGDVSVTKDYDNSEDNIEIVDAPVVVWEAKRDEYGKPIVETFAENGKVIEDVPVVEWEATNENYGQPVVNNYVENVDTPVVSTVDESQSYIMVNETVYENLVEAKEGFDRLFENGSIATQMMNHGTILNTEDFSYIDGSAQTLYNLICRYINAYESGDFDTCYQLGTQLHGFYYNGLSREYLYNIMVKRRLPENFQSDFYYDESGNVFDEYHNINLENGKGVYLVGAESDLIVAPDRDFADPFNSMWIRSEWYKCLPKILMNQYQVLNDGENADVCYVWNATEVEKTCDREWYSLKSDASELYGFNPDCSRITWFSDGNTYVYEDEDGNIYGSLSASENERVDKIYAVQDALANSYGDISYLDNTVRNMNYQGNSYQYINF